MWIQVRYPAPILNTSNFRFAFGGNKGNEIPLNFLGHPLFYEFVALKNSVLKVEKKFNSSPILSVSSKNYPSKNQLFIDSRFVEFTPEPKEEEILLPSKEQILKKMSSLLGTPYIWGGNWSQGIVEMLQFYPPKSALSEKIKTFWTLKGVDCSGLLYEATNGKTPRNTSELLNFGRPLPIKEKLLSEWISSLLPLDMIIYPGHVLFVLNKTQTIESKSPVGVVIRDLEERLGEILKERHPEDSPLLEKPDSYFMIRRFL